MDSGDVSVTSGPRGSVLADCVEQRSCFTDQKMVKLTFVWTITNFSLCRQATGQALFSSTFSAGEHKPVTWRLKLYPRGASEKYADYVSLFLVSYNTRRVSAKARFSVLDARENDTNSRQTSTRIFSRRGDSWGYEKFIGRMSLKQNGRNLLPGDTLTLKCQLTALEGSTSAPGTSGEVASSPLPQCRLSEDLEWLLDSQNYADVTFKVGDEVFQAHRSILAARSAAFRQMLEYPVEEQAVDGVVIEDVEPDVFAAILRFAYTGRVPEPIVKPKSLLKAADRYNMDLLKASCELALISCLSEESAADILILAEEHNAVTLRNATLDLIGSSADAVEETPGCESKRHIDELEQHLTTLTNGCIEPPAKRTRNS
ncbi:protein roadkill-like [Dermacentor variabilis]|uniref:protein roadkill-like n=1 Tax=Dermacentor variabilis TaxID=34621 RepID=UPI003F5BBA98